MLSETATVLKVPRFSYRGFDVPTMDLLTQLIESTPGEAAYVLGSRSTPLAWRVALYAVGRDMSLDIEGVDSLPTPVKDAGRLVYSDAQERKGRGGWHKDGAYLLPRSEAPKGMVPPNEKGVALARYLTDIDGFEQTIDGWVVKPSPNTEESLIWLPTGDGFFIVPTMDGVYNPTTGTPFETVSDRKEAIKKWGVAGLTEEQAEKEISRFYRGKVGTVAVCSWSDDINGPLCVALSGEFDYRSDDMGSFPMSRLRSEAPKPAT